MLPSIISLTDRGCYYSGPMVFGGGSLGFKKIPCPLVVNVFHVFFFFSFCSSSSAFMWRFGRSEDKAATTMSPEIQGCYFLRNLETLP